MSKNLKFLLLALLVLFAAFINVARADDDDDGDDDDDDDDDDNRVRRRGLGDGERDFEGVSGPGFRAFRVTRTTTDGTDTTVFSFRAFPVPRIRVRYFEGEITDAQVEDNEIEEKVELVATIPGFFLYTDEDGVAGYSTNDVITKRYNLRRRNGRAWFAPQLETDYVDAVRVFKLTVCRKVQDFCFVSYVANGTVEYEGYSLVPDAIKFNVIANPGAANSSFVISDNERLAVVVKVNYEAELSVEENIEENEELALNGQPEVTNDILVGVPTEQISTYFNWEKTVTVTYAVGEPAELNIIASVVSDLDFDKKTNSAGPADEDEEESDDDEQNNDDEEDDFDDEAEESEDEREEEDDDDTYTEDEEDDAVEELEVEKVLVFAIDGSLATATKIVWDPDSGTAALTVSASSADAVSMTVVKVLVAAFAMLALLM